MGYARQHSLRWETLAVSVHPRRLLGRVLLKDPLIGTLDLVVEDALVVGWRQPLVVDRGNGRLHGRFSSLLETPVENQFLGLQFVQERFRHPLHEVLVFRSELRLRLGEDVEDGEFLFRKPFANGAVVLGVEIADQGEELGKEGFGREASGVVLVDQRLEVSTAA